MFSGGPVLCQSITQVTGLTEKVCTVTKLDAYWLLLVNHLHGFLTSKLWM